MKIDENLEVSDRNFHSLKNYIKHLDPNDLK
jgi:hypothetical protein